MLLQIPVKPHVLKFLEEKYAEGYTLNERDHIGTILYTLIRRQTNKKTYEKFLGQYTENFHIEIPEEKFFKRACRHITAFTICKFNSIIEGIMRDQCMYHIYMVRHIMSEKYAILDWLELYDIEEGGTFNYISLRKNFQRFLKKKEEENNRNRQRLSYNHKFKIKKDQLYKLWAEEKFNKLKSEYPECYGEISGAKRKFYNIESQQKKFNPDRYLKRLDKAIENLVKKLKKNEKTCENNVAQIPEIKN